MMPPSRRARVIAFVLSRTLRPYADRSAAGGRDLRVLRAIGNAHGLLSMSFGARTQSVVRGSARGHWLQARGADKEQGVILYLHGGGFVLGSLPSHRDLVTRLSAATGMAVFFVNYRLAPEHPYPAAPDDVLAAYRLLLHEEVDPARIVVAGDSVGAALVGTLLHDAQRLGLPMPAGALMMSPALDVTASRAVLLDAAQRDPVLSPQFGLRCADAYLGNDSAADPRIAVLDQDTRNWPPVLIQVGDTECMRGDAEALADALARAGVERELEVWPGQVHVFQAFARILPEARAAIDRAGRFIKDHVERGDTAEDRRTRVS